MSDPSNHTGRAAGGRSSRALLAAVAAALLPLGVLANDTVDYTPDYTKFMEHDGHAFVREGPLVKKVKETLKRYTNPDAFRYETGWDMVTPCVSGNETGAMGIHVLNSSRTTSGEVKFDAPAAIIYEPQLNGKLVLVGFEYIHDAAKWKELHPEGPPALEGNLMNLVTAPNRYGLDPFYEIHVWAFEENPKGAFADWNTHVTCEKQPLGFKVVLPKATTKK